MSTVGRGRFRGQSSARMVVSGCSAQLSRVGKAPVPLSAFEGQVRWITRKSSVAVNGGVGTGYAARFR